MNCKCLNAFPGLRTKPFIPSSEINKFEPEPIKNAGIENFIAANNDDYVEKAVEYVNKNLWGNLGVSILFKNHNKKRNKKLLDKKLDSRIHNFLKTS